jgi:WhiB family redox-sensing transcriptional regulator
MTRLSMGWQPRGACRNVEPDLFFPLSAAQASADRIAAAKAVCAGCPVRRECLSFALSTRQEHGIWGGRTEQERARLRRRIPPRPAAAHRG